VSEQVRAGVRTALLRGLLALVVTLGAVVLNTVVVGQLLRGTPVARTVRDSGLGVGLGERNALRAWQAGVLQLEAGLGVPIEGRFDAGAGVFEQLTPELAGGGTFVVTVVPLTITALALGMVFLGGRAAGRAAGGSATRRVAFGALTAVPMAVGSAVLAAVVVVRLGSGGPLEGGAWVEVAASGLGSFLWPLALGGMAGALGGLRSAEREEMPFPERRLHAALAGGWRMLWLGLLSALVGLQVVSAFEPNLVIPYGPGFQEAIHRSGRGSYLAALDESVTAAPNVAAWVLLPAMGTCDSLQGEGFDTELDQELICYRSFPGPDAGEAVGRTVEGGVGELDLPAAPPQYLLFLLVPAVATVAGGWLASRNALASTAGEGALAGAGAGVVFAIAVLVVALLAGVTLRITGQQGFVLEGSIGPDVMAGALLALAWGVVGGAAGGALGVSPSPGSTPR
jgi:hypothetical protein